MNDFSVEIKSIEKELSEKFTDKKISSSRLSDIYLALERDSRAYRVKDCGSFLEFKIAEGKGKLTMANFCKDRLCPMCNWRRSLKIFGQVSKVMEHMQGYQYIFLTLTVRNCYADELKDTINELYAGWRYLYDKNPEFKKVICGTFRTLELTRNRTDDSYHPHLHVICAVKPSYFKSRYYIPHAKWQELWAKAMKIDYEPIVYVEKVKNIGKGIEGAVAEVSKYAAKGSDYLDDRNSLEESKRIVGIYLDALSGRRLCGWTGIFSKIRKQLKLDDVETGDLVQTDNEEEIRDDVACMIVRYQWKSGLYLRFE